ncbi:hypothetical protein HJC23_010519 [Cyclotella cryptica]|uniref:Uncharacterized protein n=1 Tax=Cyclotella cryptica TaxID=29204 RepID=A0ABD3QAI5_9STRA
MTKIIEAVVILAVATQIIPPHHAPPIIRPVAASGILGDLASTLNERLFPPEDYINYDVETKTLSIVEISEMRARDIKRRLARTHGYGADELARMIDKKDLINTLSFEEHKVYQQEVERRKWRRFKTTVIYTCVAVLVVMFWPLLRHAWEVAHVNFVVYTDRRKHEISRCREFHSFKGYFGIFLLFIIDMLTFWLSTSVLLSWVMTSKYFFPTPNIPIRPVELLTPKGHDAGAFGKYGINIGPMIISWFFRFLSGRVEGMIGTAMSDAFQNQRRKEKEEMKRRRKEERAKEKEERRAAKKDAKGIAKEIARQRDSVDVKKDYDEKLRKFDDIPAESMERNTNNNAFMGAHGFSTSNFDDID